AGVEMPSVVGEHRMADVRVHDGFEGGFCATRFQTARKPLILKWRDVRGVVRLRGVHLRASRSGGQAAARARHRAVARAELERERRRMKEHAWKLTPAARADAHAVP